MTLEEFIETHDHAGSIVLLEGKRVVAQEDQAKLRTLGSLLANKTKWLSFRSGNAEGSDQFFSEGVAAVDPNRLEVIVPYTGHRKKTNLASRTISLEDLNLADNPDLIDQSKASKSTRRLIDPYVAGARNRNAIKAAYIIRDTIKAIGASAIPPSSFAIFYDDLENPQQGGTGHTMLVCQQNQIPFADQTIWMKWLEDEI